MIERRLGRKMRRRRVYDGVITLVSGKKRFPILIRIDCRHGRRLKQAKAGDSVTMAINGDKEEMDNIRVGSVLSDIRNPIPMVTTFLAQVT